MIIDNQSGSLHSAILCEKDDELTLKLLHKTIKKVTEDVEGLQFNTAISAMMEFVNHIYKVNKLSKQAAKTFVLLLAPFAPHLSEELWQRLGEAQSLAYHDWPSFDPKLVKEDTVKISIQVNGKLRDVIEVEKQAPKELVLSKARELETTKRWIEGKTLKKEIYVPGRIVNFVI